MNKKNNNILKPSEEKRFLKYYPQSAIGTQVKDLKIVDYMKEPNLNEALDDTAIIYYGNEMSYKDFFNLIDNAVRTFKAMGIEKGDYVPMSSPNFIEGLACFYALNQIGAIPNMITPLASADEFEHYLKEAPVKNVIIHDASLLKFKDVLRKGNIENTVLVSPDTFLPTKLKFFKTLSNQIKGETRSLKVAQALAEPNNPIYFDKALLKYAKQYLGDISSASYNFDDTAVILHTGGTTGFPKAVEATNNNFNAMVHQYETTIDTISRGDTLLTVLPMNIGFGLCNNMHMPLRMGLKLVLHPTFNPLDAYELFKKHRPAVFMCVAPYFKAMLKDKRFDDLDLSHLREICYGGEAMNEEDKKAFNDWLQAHGAKDTVIKNGYGMNELISSVAYEAKVSENEYRTIPLLNSNIKIVKVDLASDGSIIRSDEELARGQEGEICLTSPTLTKGYKDNKEATEEVFKTHKDGIRWIHTGDLGKVDEYDGLHHLGRLKRIYLTIGEENAPIKFFPDVIEDCIRKAENVSDVCVVGVPDDEKGTVPVAYVITKDNNLEEETITFINNECEKLSTYQRPVEIYFTEEFPRTNIGKTDFVKLTNDATIRRENKNVRKRK